MLYEKDNIVIDKLKNDAISDDTPQHEIGLKLTPEQQDKIIREILDEYKAIQEDRDKLKLETRWKNEKLQYSNEENDSDFDITSGLTKDKIKKLVNRAVKAITDPDPLFVITQRPGYASKSKDEVTEAQEDFLDYVLDERIDFRKVLRRVIKSAALHGLGWMKWVFVTKTQKVRIKKKFEPKPVWVFQAGENIKFVVNTYEEAEKFLKDENTMLISYKNDCLRDFMTYLDKEAIEEYQSDIEQLYKGRTITREIEYDEVVKDDPQPKYIPIENLYIRPDIDGYEELAETRLIAERVEFYWWELEEMAKKDIFFNIHKLLYETEEDERDDKKIPNYETKKFELLECTFRVKLNEDDEEPVKCIFWIDENRKLMIGSQYYPYENIDCQYVPFNINNDDNTLYQEGLCDDLRASDNLITAILNFAVDGWYQANTITPVTENQEIIDDFYSNRWTHGLVLKANPSEISFLNEKVRTPDLNAGLALISEAKKIAEDKTGLTSGLSGAADPADPRAPWRKYITQISESRPDLIAYITELSRSINLCGYIILGMYAQLADEDIPYRVKSIRVTKTEAFRCINRADLKAKTNIQTRAVAYAIDEMQLQRELLAFYQLIRQEPLFANNPEAVNKLLRAIGKSWSPQIRNKIDEILPTNQELQMKILQVSLQAVAMYVQMELTKAQQTGQEPQFNPEVLIGTIQKYVRRIATPPTKEEIKAEKKGVENV